MKTPLPEMIERDRQNTKRRTQAHSRRQFLRTSSAVIAAVNLAPAHILGAGGQAPPNSKINLAGVGVGGVGFGQLQECEKAGFQIVSLCDVDHDYARKAFDRWPQARPYQDFREMFHTEGDRIDAVYIGTPDHTHALITLAALRRKKHVCCVKPLTRTIDECRTVIREAKKAGVATQVTAAPNTSEAACRTCELIAAGAIGAVREVHAWSSRPVWPQGISRPAGTDPIPPSLDWKLWLGPAPLRPFKADWPADHPALIQMNLQNWDPGYKAVYHPFNFRGWWDFGTGALGDMGCHHFNTPFRALKLVSPTHIQATASKVFPESAPLASLVTYDFPARQGLTAVRLLWYDGGLRPPVPPEMGNQSLPEEGILYVGDEGKMLEASLLSASRAQQFAALPKTLPRRAGTWSEWLEACRGGEPAGCHFDWAGPLTEAVLLGNAAIRSGQRLSWNASLMKFDQEKANRFLKDEYHNGWSLDNI